MTTPTTVAHTVRLKKGALRPAMRRAGIELMSTLARSMGMGRSGLDRVVMYGKQPGPRFIGSLLAALPREKFDDLFEVVEEQSEANAA